MNKTIAHNWSRKYMKDLNKPSRYKDMDDHERKLFLYVRETNINILNAKKR